MRYSSVDQENILFLESHNQLLSSEMLSFGEFVLFLAERALRSLAADDIAKQHSNEQRLEQNQSNQAEDSPEIQTPTVSTPNSAARCLEATATLKCPNDATRASRPYSAGTHHW